MKRFALLTLSAALFAAATPLALAGDPREEVHALVEKVRGKLQEGAKTEESLAPELAAFDALLAEHKDEKTDDVAYVLFMKGLLYTQALDEDEKAIALFKQVETDYPGTVSASNAEKAISNVAGQAAANKIKATLKEGSLFPPIDEKDIDGKPLSTASYKGKVLLIEFWATWCGPCVAEMPNVQKAYEQYHAQGLEVIGISLDQDRETLMTFLKEKNLPWQQYFDGQGWESKLAQRYGVRGIPAVYLLDREGKIIASDLRGEELNQALAKALQ